MTGTISLVGLSFRNFFIEKINLKKIREAGGEVQKVDCCRVVDEKILLMFSFLQKPPVFLVLQQFAFVK